MLADFPPAGVPELLLFSVVLSGSFLD